MMTPPSPIDHTAARDLWAEYVSVHPTTLPDDEELPVDRFGDHAELIDALLALVLAGTKRATAGLVDDYLLDDVPLPRIGGFWIAADSAGVPRAVLRSTYLRIGVIESVDEAFAFDEGEIDRTRAGWLAAHRRFFGRACADRDEPFGNTHELVFERFTVVWPAEFADGDLPELSGSAADSESAVEPGSAAQSG